MKYIYLIMMLLSGAMASVAQPVRLPAIYKGEDIKSTTTQTILIKPLLSTQPAVISNTLTSMTGRYLSEYCISHAPFSFVTVTATRKDDNTVSLEFETIDEFTSHSFSIERVLATGTEHREITRPEDSSFYVLLKMGMVREFAPFNFQYAKNKGAYKAKYQLSDQNSFTGISFYRITETGQDTSKVFSKIVAVIGKPIKETLAVFPNPAVNQANVTVFSKTGASSRLQVFNNQGVIVKEIAVNIVEGTNNLSIPVTGLASGTYFIRILRNQNSPPLQTQLIKM